MTRRITVSQSAVIGLKCKIGPCRRVEFNLVCLVLEVSGNGERLSSACSNEGL